MPGLLRYLLLLMLFNILLFVSFRLYEWYESGFVASQPVDPESLSVPQLKNLLDGRGVDYKGILEKKELSHLVDQSGDVFGGELMMAESEKVSTLFRSREHFYEEVEDKDSVWLIQVIPPGHLGLLPSKTWKTVKRKVSHIGIRTGTFNCTLDPRFCLKRKWIEPSILLAMPQGETYKDHVTMFHRYNPGRTAYILDWINTHLKSNITILSNHGDTRNWLETAKSHPNHFPIYVAYYSKNDHLPLFFSSLSAQLSVKFTGRIKFAFTSTYPMEFSLKRSQKDNLKDQSILIVTPEGTLLYNKYPGEFLSYAGLVFYLKTLSLDLNDASIWSLLLVNVLCVFEFFVTQGGILERSSCLMWTVVKSTACLALLWYFFLFLELFELSIITAFRNFANKILHKFLISNIMWYIRFDVLVYYLHNTTFLLLTFLTYCCIIGLIEKYRKKTTTVSQESNTARPPNVHTAETVPEIDSDRRTDTQTENLRHHRINPRQHLIPLNRATETVQEIDRRTYTQTENLRGLRINPRQNLILLNRAFIEEIGLRLIDELATENPELHPLIPQEYISNLPTWKYCNLKVTDCHQLLGKPCGSHDFQEQKMNVECSHVESRKSSDINSPAVHVPDSRVGDGRDQLPSPRDDVDQQLNADALETINSQKGHDFQPNVSKKKHALFNNLMSTDCIICFEVYCHGDVICGLPCGHSFHHSCIETLLRKYRHLCPNCRWPATRIKL